MLPQPIQNVADKLRLFPGVGSRSSQKLALDMLQLTDEQYEEFIGALKELRRSTGLCMECGFFAENKPNHQTLCSICNDPSRNKSQICIVEKPTDVLTVEKSSVYRGLYHVSRHLISPLDKIFVEETTLTDLIDRRLQQMSDQKKHVELILFFKAGFSGEATTAYLKEAISQKGLSEFVSITRLAQGLPLYFNPDTLDQATMAKALEDRREVV